MAGEFERSFAFGNEYASQLFDTQARKKAGSAVAAGDYQGASQALGERGDVEGAHRLRTFQDTQKNADVDRKLKMFQAQTDYMKRAVPIFAHIYKTAGPQAALQAFDQIAPELQQLGVPPETVAQYKQAFAQNPEQTLQMLGAATAKEYEFRNNGDDILVFEKGNPTPVNTIKGAPKAPAPPSQADMARDANNAFRADGSANTAFQQYETDKARKSAENRTESPQAQQRNSVQLRKEFDALPEVKQFNEVANAVEIVQQLAASKTAADDVGLIFSFMKTLDPNSVVRETEFATAQNAAGIPDQIRNMYNRALSGNRLNDTQRGQFVQTVRSVYDARRKRYDQIIRQYQGYARDYGLPEGTVSPRDPMSAAPQQPAGGRIPYANAQPSPQGGNVIRYDAQGNRVQ